VTIAAKKTTTGVAYRSSVCKDDFDNMRTEDILGQRLHLQLCALRAYRRACKEFADRSGWSEERIKRTGGRPILVTGTWRSCALQTHLHEEDPDRFASANGSLHPQGLAIDVDTRLVDFAKASASLTHLGWHIPRPDDEPWHHSWAWNA
jgi:hypothetical protein